MLIILSERIAVNNIWVVNKKYTVKGVSDLITINQQGKSKFHNNSINTWSLLWSSMLSFFTSSNWRRKETSVSCLSWISFSRSRIATWNKWKFVRLLVISNCHITSNRAPAYSQEKQRQTKGRCCWCSKQKNKIKDFLSTVQQHGHNAVRRKHTVSRASINGKRENQHFTAVTIHL